MANATAPKKGLEQKPAGESKKNRKKKEKVKRVAWGVRNDKGQLVEKIKGKDAPGFDAKVNLPLRKNDFENPVDYYELSADRLEAKAAHMRQLAKDESALGSVADRKKAKKFKGIADKFTAMRKEMLESGMTEEQIAQFLAGPAA